jgi:hypothetical protein
MRMDMDMDICIHAYMSIYIYLHIYICRYNGKIMTTVEEIKYIQLKNEKIKNNQYINDTDNDLVMNDDNLMSISGGVGLYGNVRVVQQIWNLLATVVEVYIASGVESMICSNSNNSTYNIDQSLVRTDNHERNEINFDTSVLGR